MGKRGNVLMQKYEFGKLLGQGNFAKVYHARDLKTGESVAVKVIEKEKILKIGLVDQTKREISIMRRIKHPNVLQLFEVLATKTKIYFIMEYAKGGELFNKVAKGRLSEARARKYFQQLVSAVDFCHSKGVYHRDLKPENLLLDENGVLKVADFGLSAFVESHRQDDMLHTVCGTPAYVAPEVVSRKGYNGAKSDVWSCGVILFVLLAGHLPFYDLNLMSLYRKIGRAEYKCPNWFSIEVRRLLGKILDPNPDTRISMAKVMENSWFRKGFKPNSGEVKRESANVDLVNSDQVFGLCENTITASVEAVQELVAPGHLNAFDIISLSAGLDLSGLFANISEQEDIKFTFMSSASSIMSTVEDIARILRMVIIKKDGGLLKLERSKAGRKEPLSIDVEIFEVAPSFHLVEMKSGGDTLEFQKIVKEDLRPALKDIVFVWQDEHYLQQQDCTP
ncbi:CBL-interacting protein kinase 2-like [Vigna radiata var. radiata]|uniref:non-specific serine/threonine protein kinase n=1 Tax=Vigna radiata var. radiata TaxID=3916 RepID=A0A1S3TES7_VIGRR|nr:CBL-interacting protein kinase 2-like [Vigna radiata var. radiata]XP_014492281.1 CBL-interacting protein kinase 2-like [Vigna radiata var. radiata]XP_022634578.1 CBL-interacting protein kinase 2-like [Vigna radiata var. radiata]